MVLPRFDLEASNYASVQKSGCYPEIITNKVLRMFHAICETSVS